MTHSEIKQNRRKQSDYPLPFKLQVIRQIEGGEMTYIQAQNYYGIQGKSTVLVWLRKYGTLDWTNPMRVHMPKSKETPAQRIKRLEKELSDEKLKNKILNTMIDISDKQHDKKKLITQAFWRIRQQRAESLSRCCRLFGISRQAVYQRQWRQDVRMKEKEKVINLVLQERMSLPRLGTRKLYYLIKPKLESQGIKMGRDGLFTCLRLNHMLVKPKKSYTKTTMSKHWLHKHPNLLKDIKLQYPEQVYVSDITYIKSRQKTHYLSLVTDAYSRKIVGYHLSDDLNAESVVNALKMAVKGRNKDIPLIHHSDRGLQYCSAVYQKVLHKYNITPSMTDGYDCYQNALAERVNGILKQELLGDICNNYKDLKLLVKHSIEIYNMKRPHLALNMKTPNFIHQKTDGYKSIGSYNILV